MARRYNQIKETHPIIFKGLTSLEKIWLGSNQIEEIEPGLFNGLIRA